MRCIQALDAMERITRHYLCDHFDEILEKVSADNIGYVILDNDGNDGHVLCPAKWMKIELDDTFSYFFSHGIRYAMEQQSSSAEIMVDFIRNNLNIFDPLIIKTIIENIEEGMARDNTTNPAMWQDLRDELIAKSLILSGTDQVNSPQISETTTISSSFTQGDENYVP